MLHKIIRMAEADIQNKAVYRSVAHVCPTSVVVERLFSQTKHIMTDNRKLMDPSTLEMCIMLKTNKDLWNAKTVDDVIELCRQETKATNSSKRGSKRTIDAVISVVDESADEDEKEENEEDGKEEAEDEEDES